MTDLLGVHSSLGTHAAPEVQLTSCGTYVGAMAWQTSVQGCQEGQAFNVYIANCFRNSIRYDHNNW
jgi:hypothetical protein